MMMMFNNIKKCLTNRMNKKYKMHKTKIYKTYKTYKIINNKKYNK